MQLLTDIPAGITLEKGQGEWRLVAHDHASKHLPNLIFHGVGLVYIIVIELFLIIDFLQEWQYNLNDWIKWALYGLQGFLFFWIMIEMLRSIFRILNRRRKILYLFLRPNSFGLHISSKKRPPKVTTNYTVDLLQDIHCNHSVHPKSIETKALLLNIPLKIFIHQEAQPPTAWGEFLREEQLLYLTELLRVFYFEGKARQEIGVVEVV